jgi:hypothetical protein
LHASKLALCSLFHLDDAAIHAVHVGLDGVQTLGGSGQILAGLLGGFTVLLDLGVSLFNGAFDFGLAGVQMGLDFVDLHDVLSD